MAPLIVHAGPRAAAAGLEALIDLYAEVFASPPYYEGPEDVLRFRKLLTAELEQPGFALVRAIEGSELVGMAYGFTFAPEVWWPGSATPAPPEALGVPKFAVMELAVRADHQGRGLGRALLGALLDDRAEPLAVLTVAPAAPADAIYRAWGWRPAGHTIPDPESHSFYNILCFDLPVMTE
ncbi:GNAT family N-acetyltransferase [Nocardia sp. NPDC048505]|uniref:GNAT family N-acetyltransferase n=1 Tax=unclassified Nocardia TaxID=2637762 RepID=UPI0033F98AC1